MSRKALKLFFFKDEKRKRLDTKTEDRLENVAGKNEINENSKDDDNQVDENNFKKKRVIFEHKIKVKDNETFLKQIFS